MAKNKLNSILNDMYGDLGKEFSSGGKIHIKPENRGKFNALKKRTGKTTEELTHSKNPLTRKRAIFAQNAKKWHHGEYGLDLEEETYGPPDGIPKPGWKWVGTTNEKTRETGPGLPPRQVIKMGQDVKPGQKIETNTLILPPDITRSGNNKFWPIPQNKTNTTQTKDNFSTWTNNRPFNSRLPSSNIEQSPVRISIPKVSEDLKLDSDRIYSDGYDYEASDKEMINAFSEYPHQIKGWNELHPNNPYEVFTPPQVSISKNKPNDYATPIAAGLAALDALIPDKYRTQQVVRPLDSFNTKLYGRGSQALFEDGGSMRMPFTATSLKDGGHLSPEKAKEMLRDGTANGKKLTAKQKRYFGMVAAGKAEFGMELGEETPNSTASSAPKGYVKRTVQQRQAWNKLLDFASERGLSGKPELDNRDKNMSIQLINEFNKTNPNMRIDPNEIQYYQYELGSINSGNFPDIVLSNKDYAEIYKNRMYAGKDTNKFITRPRSAVDNWFGSLTSTQYYPQNEVVSANKRTNYGVDYDKYAEAIYQEQQRMNNVGKYKSGGKIFGNDNSYQVLDGSSEAENISYNPYDGGTVEFSGPSHEDGGIPLRYGNNLAEVEGDEIATHQGDVFGGMIVPSTNKMFKTVGKELAAKENKNLKKFARGQSLMQENDVSDPFGKLAFNSGFLKAQGGDKRLEEIAYKKKGLADLQQNMLDLADSYGIDPDAMSKGKIKKAKYGAKMGYGASGYSFEEQPPKKGKKLTMAQRHNNPGNIKFGDFAKRFGAVKGDAALDGGYFSKFPDVETGLKALRTLLKTDNYKNLSVMDAIKRWTNNHPYKNIDNTLKNKTISNLSSDQFNRLVDTITNGEDGKYYKEYHDGTQTTTDNETPVTTDKTNMDEITVKGYKKLSPLDEKNPTYSSGRTPYSTTGTKPGGPLNDITYEERPPSQSDADYNKLDISQIAPELLSLATNRRRPVPQQRYTPQLYTPYQVSFQDQIDENNAEFNAIQKTLRYNPAALGTLAAQTYAANNKVKAEEFRTNQGIENDVINKNVSVLNDANLKNLQFAHEQLLEQEQARSNTRRDTNLALSSIASKNLQNKMDNTRLKIYDDMFDYRLNRDEKGQATGGWKYMGGPAPLNMNGSFISPSSVNADPGTQVQRIYDPTSGKQTAVKTITDSPNKQQLQKIEITNKLWNQTFGRRSRF